MGTAFIILVMSLCETSTFDEQTDLSKQIGQLWLNSRSKEERGTEKFENELRNKLELQSVSAWWSSALNASLAKEAPKGSRFKCFEFVERDSDYVLSIQLTSSKTTTYRLHPKARLTNLQSAVVFDLKSELLIVLPHEGIGPSTWLMVDTESGSIVGEQLVDAIPHSSFTGTAPEHQMDAVLEDDCVVVFGIVGTFFYGFSASNKKRTWQFCFRRDGESGTELFINEPGNGEVVRKPGMMGGTKNGPR